MGLLGIERARAIIEWWLQQGSGVVRLTGVLVLALGGFVAFACAPGSTRGFLVELRKHAHRADVGLLGASPFPLSCKVSTIR